MGRVGALSAGVGSYNVVYGYTAFGTGWGDTVGAKSLFNLGDRDRMDNTVTYVTPKFGGHTAYAQYSFNANGAEDAQSSFNKRCAGLGLKYDLGAFSTGLVVDTVMNKGTDANSEDSLGVSWGASYDFGVAKVLGIAQYGQNENKLGGFVGADAWISAGEGTVTAEEGMKGYAVALGVAAPVFGGTAFAQVNYVDRRIRRRHQHDDSRSARLNSTAGVSPLPTNIRSASARRSMASPVITKVPSTRPARTIT